MMCPICSEGTRVIDTRGQDFFTLRVRRCEGCDFSFSTIETVLAGSAAAKSRAAADYMKYADGVKLRGEQ